MNSTGLLEAVQQAIGSQSPADVSKALGNMNGWGHTEAEYIEFLQSKGYTVIEGSNGSYSVFNTAETVTAGNGTATEISSLFETTATETTIEGAEVTSIGATGTGAGMLAMDVGVAGAAIAPALGLLAGVALYNLTPEFWNGVADTLLNAGKLDGNGKVRGAYDTNGKTSFDEETIEIFKNAFLAAGLFEKTVTQPEIPENNSEPYNVTTSEPSTLSNVPNNHLSELVEALGGVTSNKVYMFDAYKDGSSETLIEFNAPLPFTLRYYTVNTLNNIKYLSSENMIHNETNYSSRSNRYALYDRGRITTGSGANTQFYISPKLEFSSYFRISSGNFSSQNNENAQPDATLPDSSPFNITFPSWNPLHIINNNNYYPVSMPTDNSTQQPSQTGNNDEDEEKDVVFNLLTNPNPEPQEKPKPDPDPSPQPEPTPQPDPDPTPDPINPNPNPVDSGDTPVIPVTPSMQSNALFAVYNPTDAQVNSLGAFLWSTNVITQIKQMWQNPLDGVISLHKVYCQPSTSGSHNIYLGYIDSGVSSAIVSSQFAEVDCGSVSVPENKNNATDYSPFTQIHIYLPFIGIQELDTSEIMGGSVNVKYKIDVYTGTCIAMIFVTRSPDMTNSQLLYTFSGNCSQKLPLTSADFGGAIASLLGIVGIGVASGGSLGVAAGALGVAHSLTSDMVHIQRSGGLSANSGILAPRTPFIIISRQYGYDANNYSNIYGYPANKTVYLSNCVGYTRVKDLNYKGDGTFEEKRMIAEQLKKGVII